MLTGEKPPETRWQRMAKALLIRAIISPLTLMGAGLTWVGALSLGPRKDISELWICLPAGLALLLVLQGILWWATIWLPRHTILRFVLEGDDLALETRAHGAFVWSLKDIDKISVSRNRRGQVTGYWIRWRKKGQAFLEANMPDANELLRSINSIKNL
jgi:hypothetical protein